MRSNQIMIIGFALHLGLWAFPFPGLSPLLAAPPQERAVKEESPAGDGTEIPAQMEAAGKKILEDIEKARHELADLNNRVRSERTDLVKRIDALRVEVRSLQSEREALQRDEDRLRTETENMTREKSHLEEVMDFLDELMLEYRRSFETKISRPEQQEYADRLDGIDDLLRPESSFKRLAAIPALLELAREHLATQAGGKRLEGEALDPSGRLVRGRFAQLGPVDYFSAQDHTLAGLAVQRIGSMRSTVFQRFESDKAVPEIRGLVEEGRGTVPVDVTLGSAVKLRQADEPMLEHLRKGGITMIPLMVLACACILIALYKSFSLPLVLKGRSEKKVVRIIDELKNDRTDEAIALAGSLAKPLGPAIREGILHRNAPKRHLEEILYEKILSQIPSLERLLTPLAVCASAAPLLGLLGTVTGMMHTFKLITVFGTGDASRLSSGISEALITTEVGLVIAIPALMIHAYLSRRVRKTVALARQHTLMFLNSLKLRNGNGFEERKESRAP